LIGFCKRFVGKDEAKRSWSNEIAPAKEENRNSNSKIDGLEMSSTTLHFGILLVSYK